MAQTTKWVDPRDAPRVAKLREMDGGQHWKQKIRDRLAARGEAIKAHDDWMLAHPGAPEEEIAAQRAALKEAVESAAADIAHFDRLLATQQSRIDAATKKVDDTNWAYALEEEQRLQPTVREQLQRFLETPPIHWKKFLPELMLTAMLIEKNRQDVAYLGRQSRLPPNVCPLPGLTESVPRLMYYFSQMAGATMNGLAGRIVVPRP
jgi:hypothetical protein